MSNESIPAPEELQPPVEGQTAEEKQETAPVWDFDYSLSFPIILDKLGISLAVTTYQAGSLCLITAKGEDAKLDTRGFRKAMGCYIHPQGMLLATQHQVIAFSKAAHLAQRYYPDENYDEVYIPQMSFYTGDIAAHDVALMNGQPIAVSSNFSCLVAMNPEYSFTPIWKPHFVSALACEDRCHLNGMAIENGMPRYVTALGSTDSEGAWRENKASGGIVMDVKANQIICRGLSMPHSPRIYNQDLWILNSGTGELGIVNSLGFQSMIYLPGFLRGLAFYGPYAFIGLSKIREKRTFGGLPIEEKAQALRCTIEVVNIETGLWEGNLEFHKSIEELYDVQVIPKVRNPKVVGYEQKGDIQRLFDLPPQGQGTKAPLPRKR